MLALLDNPIWNALTGPQQAFAERDGLAARFAPDVTLLAGLATSAVDERALRDAQDALARLLTRGSRVGLFVDPALPLAPSLTVVDEAPVTQMIHPAAPAAAPDERGLRILGADDVPAMLALATLTRPGPFGTRTRELGTFLGITEDDRPDPGDGTASLVAMAGQRMRLPGMIEVSAVCTHPSRAGRGLSTRLLQAQIARIHRADAMPFLHVRSDNAGAIGLYERLGFAERRRFRYAIVRAA